MYSIRVFVVAAFVGLFLGAFVLLAVNAFSTTAQPQSEVEVVDEVVDEDVFRLDPEDVDDPLVVQLYGRIDCIEQYLADAGAEDVIVGEDEGSPLAQELLNAASQACSSVDDFSSDFPDSP